MEDLFQNRTLPDEYYYDVYILIYNTIKNDYLNNSTLVSPEEALLLTDQKENITTGFIRNAISGGYAGNIDVIESLYIQITNSSNLTAAQSKSYSDAVYFGWIYQNSQTKDLTETYLSKFNKILPPEPEIEEEPEVTDVPPDFPVYRIRSTSPANNQGARGSIFFEEIKQGNKKLLQGTGEMDNNLLNTLPSAIGWTPFDFDRKSSVYFFFSSSIITSENYDFLSLGNQIVKNLQNQNDEFIATYQASSPNGNDYLLDDRGINLEIVSGPNFSSENVFEYEFVGIVRSDKNGRSLSEVYISDDADKQGLPQSSTSTSEFGQFTLRGYYLAESPSTDEIIRTIDYTVISGDTLSKIALQYPQKGLDGKDIPFYPDRTMQIFKANPFMQGRTIPVSEAANDSQVLENADLIFEGETIVIPFYNYTTKPKTFNISFEKEGYITKTMVPFTGENEVLPFQKILLQSKAPSKKSTISNIPYTDDQVKSVTSPSIKEDPLGSINDIMLQELTKRLKTTLQPFLISLLARFGITNVDDAMQKGLENINFQCPANLDELNELILQKNKITKQLNNIYDRLNTIKKVISGLDIFISVADVIFSTLSAVSIAFPAVPFAPDFTKPFTEPLPTKEKKSTLEITADIIKKMGIVTSSTLLILTILSQLIQGILNYLSLLDNLIEECSSKMGVGEDSILKQERISFIQELSTAQQSLQGSGSSSKKVRGFDISVITVENQEIEGEKRRRAIAKNPDGVVMLRGEPSFSSNDQILIDELAFYIEQNDLKAD